MDESCIVKCEIKIEEEEISYEFADDSCCSRTPSISSSDCISNELLNKSTTEKVTMSNSSSKNRAKMKKPRMTSWNDYLKAQANLPTYYCTQCSFETSWKCYLKNHMKIHSPPEEIQMYKCLQCTFKSKWRFSLINHMKVHSPPETLKMYKCPKCSYETKWNNGLTSHMKVHIKPKIIKIYNCTKCSYETKSKSDLGEHMKIHEPVQNMYKCPLCSFQTKFRHGVHHHLKVHNWRN